MKRVRGASLIEMALLTSIVALSCVTSTMNLGQIIKCSLARAYNGFGPVDASAITADEMKLVNQCGLDAYIITPNEEAG